MTFEQKYYVRVFLKMIRRAIALHIYYLTCAIKLDYLECYKFPTDMFAVLFDMLTVEHVDY